MTLGLSVLVTPRVEHYHDLLYQGIEACGVRVHYLEGPTSSQSLNLVLAPAGLIWFRFHGFRILHIHWVFQFSLPWARRKRWARQLMEWWFGVYLRTARVLGYRIVWTAHDLLPHEQVFANDVRARELLISKASAVIALSEATATDLRALGARLVRVIPIGPYADQYPVTVTRDEARASFGFTDDDLVVALIGRIEEYKGADLLLRAIAKLPDSSNIKLLLAGLCPDEVYRDKVVSLMSETQGRTVARLEWVPDDDLARFYQATDIAVFPFRAITNSASVLLAQSFEKPIMISDLPALGDIPGGAVIRFTLEEDSLLDALDQAERLSGADMKEMGAAGLAWATRFDWAHAAQATVDTYELVSLR